MAAIQTILETIFQYPASALFKDFKDLSVGHKPFRNLWRLLCGSIGSTLGGVAPTVLAPSISHYAASVVSAILPISGPPSYITGNLALVYLGLTTGLVFGKYSAQAYYYARYRDTNSGHRLYNFERDAVVKLYQATDKNLMALELRVEGIHHYLISEIRRAKSKYKGSPLEPVALAWTKEQLKGVLNEFMRGNDDPFIFLYKLAAMKNNFLQVRLQARIVEIEQLLVEDVPMLSGVQTGQPYQRLNSPGLVRHRRRATVSETELHNKHPKLHRYVTQIANIDNTSHVPATELERVKTLLLSRAQEVRKIVQEIPKPLVSEEILRSPQPYNRGLRLDV